MRPLIPCLLLALLLPVPDAAARRARPSPGGPFHIAVAPFEGDGGGGLLLAEAMELELELVETVMVTGDRWLRSDLRQAGEAGWTPAGLTRILQKRGIDILVRGRRAGDGVEVIAFGKDGQPRFVQRFPLPRDPDASAREIIGALTPTLLRWARAPVVRAPRERPARAPASPPPADDLDDADLFVDVDEPASRRPVRDAPLEAADAMPAGDAVPPRARPSEEEWDSPVKSPRPSPAPVDGGGRRLLDEDAPKKQPRRQARRRVVDDEPAERSRRTMADPEEERGAGDKASPFPWLSLSAGASAEPWYYGYAALRYAQDDLTLPLLTAGGVSARVIYWPIAYAGVEAHGHVSYLPIDAGTESIRPSELKALHFGGGLMARARYPFTFGDFTVAPGVRAGYRHWSSTVEPQTSLDDDLGLTLVPGWTMHALAVGADVLFAYVIGRWRVELEAQAEPLPLMIYEEKPDNPGAIAKPLGAAGALILRVPVYGPLFVSLEGRGTAVLVEWACRSDGSPTACYGTRFSPVRKNEAGGRERMEGGESLNVSFGGAAHVGLCF
jgi:hypothetical protein